MKAVILAGGEGTRLRPLTCNIPKPLVHICSKPVLLYILDLLDRHGCEEAAAAVRYKGEQIEELLSDGRYKNVKTFISYEDKPLGTAGCVKKAAKDYEDDFIVISGDAVCDFDLKAIYEHHKDSGALATIVAKKVDDPREYGLLIGENGTVKGFCEKPSYINCRGDLANTGIYIVSPKVLELIPDDTMWDFAKNVFPEMLTKKLKLCYCEENGYWCDIGDIPAYKRCCRDMTAGRVGLELPERDEACYALPDVSREAFVCKGSVISGGALIKGNTVIGSGVYISDGAKLSNAIVLNGAFIGSDTTLNDCVVCTDAKICSGAAVYENAVVGEGSVVGENTVVSSGVRIWQNKQIAKATFVTGDVKYGTNPTPDMTEEGICGATNTLITPTFTCKLGCAVSEIAKRPAAVACSGGGAAGALKSSFISGMTSAGKDIRDFGELPLPMLTLAAGYLKSDVIVHITSQVNTRILVLAPGGLPLTRSQERILENALNRGEFMNAGWESFGRAESFGGGMMLYEASLDEFSGLSLPYNITVCCRDANLKGFCRSFAERISKGREKLTITLNERGTAAEISSGGIKLDHTALMLIACECEAERGVNVALPFAFPHTAELTAQRYGQRILRYYASSMDNRDTKARITAAKQQYSFDGFYLALKVLSYLSEKGLAIDEATEGIPHSSTENRFIHINCPPQRILGRIDASPEENEGALIAADGERVFLRPDKRGTGIYMYAESFGTETAASLCDKTEKLIRDAMRKDE